MIFCHKKNILFISVLTIYTYGATLCAGERIELFESTITIQQDGTVDVVENITVSAQLKKIKHGIFRTLRLEYAPLYSWLVKKQYRIHEILHNNTACVYQVNKRWKDLELKIGNKDGLITRGIHTYTIHYSMPDQIAFFDVHDELYWNVTGNDWLLPINKVKATVILPARIAGDDVRITAYTGAFGAREKDFKVVQNGAAIVFESTRTLFPGDGFTIVVGLPKGHIQNTWTWQLKAWLFLYYSLYGVFAVLLLCYVLYYLFLWYKRKKEMSTITVIPLFYPPNNILPGEIVYLNTYGNRLYLHQALASDIVAMAVLSYLTIEYKKAGLWGGEYILHKKESPPINSFYASLFSALFGEERQKVILNEQIVSAVAKRATGLLEQNMKNFLLPMRFTVIDIAMIIIFCIAFFGFGIYENTFLKVVFFLLGLFMVATVYFCKSAYTRTGMELYQKIQGFKLFLSTTEAERLKIIGTPPTKNPELYEKYLPYAIALGVEKAWTNQFAPIFKQTGYTYTPTWYVGNRSFDMRTFATDFSKSFSSALASLNRSSGSGFGKGGSSGGGRGGGGGGGW